MLISIDIGIRNLAFCAMDCSDKTDLGSYNIHFWDVINTLENSEETTCKTIQKNGKVCGKKSGYKYTEDCNTIYCCKLHFPKTIDIKTCNIFKKKLIKNYLLQDIAKIIIDKMNCIYNENIEVFEKATQIIIELQPSMNQKMKMISHILYGKLVEMYRDTKTTIRFVRASQKLKAYTGPYIECKLKGAYAQRKWLSVKYTEYFLNNKFSDEQKNKWLKVLEDNKSKADDACDTFLMAINGLFGVPRKPQKTSFKKKNLE
jgi:hypothetical protein